MASPIEQFQIKPLIPVLNFTNSSLFMVGATAAIIGGLLFATRHRAVVPGRAQAVAEMLHDFVAGTLRDAAGQEGMRFFPLVFSLFMFVLTANMLGMVPGFFTLAGHIALKVFGGFVVSLGAAGVGYAILAPLPLLMAVALTALEFLVAFLQAH